MKKKIQKVMTYVRLDEREEKKEKKNAFLDEMSSVKNAFLIGEINFEKKI